MTDMQMYAEVLVKLGYWFMGGIAALVIIVPICTLLKWKREERKWEKD